MLSFLCLERTIGLLERPYAILQQHGEQYDKVKFYLQYPSVQGAPTQAGNNEKEEKSKSSGNENDGLYTCILILPPCVTLLLITKTCPSNIQRLF